MRNNDDEMSGLGIKKILVSDRNLHNVIKIYQAIALCFFVNFELLENKL